jgi:hypothetical protein
MDQIYFWIIILFVIILILDYTDKYFKNNKEKFDNFDNVPNSLLPPYYEENRLVTYEPPYTTNAVNIGNSTNLNFKNFGTNGITPPFLKCPPCELQFGCSNYPYDVDDKNQSVCTGCFEKVSLDANNMPVYSRGNGKPRVCRNLEGGNPLGCAVSKVTNPIK